MAKAAVIRLRQNSVQTPRDVDGSHKAMGIIAPLESTESPGATSMLELKVGDHLGDQPASYTRFVLPFRYRLENLPEEAVYDAVYRPSDAPHRIWRERYLTVETADVLFRRGRGLGLETN